jgi:Transposase, Mutator family
VSTRKVKAITDELCGHSFSRRRRSARSTPGWTRAWPSSPAGGWTREAGVIRGQAVLVAIGIGWDGRRSILAVELANRERRSSWRDFPLQLRERGLSGVEFVVSDDHAGLKQAIVEILPEAAWQRCYVHFLRNALDYVPRKVDDDCLRELRWLYDRRDLGEARRDLAAWLAKWQATYLKLCGWVEERIEETLTFYRLPRQHHKHSQLPPSDPGARGRDAREPARSAPLPQHGRPAGAQEGGPAQGGVMPTRTLRSATRAPQHDPFRRTSRTQLRLMGAGPLELASPRAAGRGGAAHTARAPVRQAKGQAARAGRAKAHRACTKIHIFLPR